MTLEFRSSEPLTLGVELELQLVNTRDYNLTRGASDLLAAVAKRKHPGDIKPEITESMIEMSTSVCSGPEQVRAELEAMRAVVADAAAKLNLGVAGGGTHPFQRWSERRIYDTPRFRHVSELYGYLAKQFTVFGQHVHIGVRSGDEAVRLTHALARYVPHFIALSASSPFAGGADTQFDSSRLNVVNAFPLAGCMPFVADWDEFEHYFGEMHAFGIVESMKDFYWDIRPKPEYGTVEVRVFDTPLTVARAADLAAYAQALAAAAARRPELGASPEPVPRLQLQPVPGLPIRLRRRDRRSFDARAGVACRRDRRHAHASGAARRAARRRPGNRPLARVCGGAHERRQDAARGAREARLPPRRGARGVCGLAAVLMRR